MKYGTEVRRTVIIDVRKSKAAELGKQGVWMLWDLSEHRLTWTEL
jgi:hypothetical protein